MYQRCYRSNLSFGSRRGGSSVIARLRIGEASRMMALEIDESDLSAVDLEQRHRDDGNRWQPIVSFTAENEHGAHDGLR